jgi:hypothetical protein
MQQVNISVGTICRTARRHTPEMATYSYIRTAHSLMCLYMDREWTGYRIPLEGEGVARFIAPVKMELGPIHPSGIWEYGLYPEGKLSGT